MALTLYYGLNLVFTKKSRGVVLLLSSDIMWQYYTHKLKQTTKKFAKISKYVHLFL